MQKERKNVVHNKIIPELVSGSSTPAVMQQQALKALKKFQGLSNLITTRAFTLIELLVVVLIIGILAAVAVPQYQKAVLKSRLVQLQTLSDSLAKAAKVYYLTNNEWPYEFSQLDIDIPHPLSINNPHALDTCASFDNFYCCMAQPRVLARSGAITCGKNDYSIAWMTLFANSEGKASSLRYCYETQNLGLCQSIPNCNIINNATSAVTPEGNKNFQGFYCPR